MSTSVGTFNKFIVEARLIADCRNRLQCKPGQQLRWYGATDPLPQQRTVAHFRLALQSLRQRRPMPQHLVIVPPPPAPAATVSHSAGDLRD